MVVAFFSGQVPVALRPQNKMPAVGHQAIAENPHRPSFQSVDDHRLEGQIILVGANPVEETNQFDLRRAAVIALGKKLQQAVSF